MRLHRVWFRTAVCQISMILSATCPERRLRCDVGCLGSVVDAPQIFIT